jgi:hypothetical protein
VIPDEFNGAGADQVTKWLDAAKEAGDAIEAKSGEGLTAIKVMRPAPS